MVVGLDCPGIFQVFFFFLIGLTVERVRKTKEKRRWLIIGLVFLLVELIIISIYFYETKVEIGKTDVKLPEKAISLPPANIYLHTVEESVMITSDHPWSEQTRQVTGEIIANLEGPRTDLPVEWPRLSDSSKVNNSDVDTSEINTIEELEKKYVVLNVWLSKPVDIKVSSGDSLSVLKFSIVLGGQYKGTVFIQQPEKETYSPWLTKPEYIRKLVEVFRNSGEGGTR